MYINFISHVFGCCSVASAHFSGVCVTHQHGEQLCYFDMHLRRRKKGQYNHIFIEVGNERKWNIDVVIMHIHG